MPLKQTDYIDGYTRLVGLLGWPAGPWLSPMIYNAAFDALGLNWRYVPLPVPEGRLREALLGLRALGFAGAEVTEPHQCDALNHLEELSPAAETIGAVNFIQVDERGWLVGDNTRWRSFLRELHAISPSLDGLRPLVIGAGAAARSIVYALTREGLPVTIVNRRMDQAIELVHNLRHVLNEHSFGVYRWPHDLERVAVDANLIINTISIGMWPDVSGSPDGPPAPLALPARASVRAGPFGSGDAGSPWPDDLPFPSDAVVFDLVYPGESPAPLALPAPWNRPPGQVRASVRAGSFGSGDASSRPGETRFLRQARAGGAKTVSGLQLLVHEAVLAFAKWTGQTPSIEVMFQAAEQALGEERSQDTLWSTDVLAPAPNPA